MSETNPEDKNEAKDGGCCPTGEGSSCCGGGSGKGGVFMLVLIVAIGVAVFAMTKGQGEDKTASPSPTEATEAVDEGGVEAVEDSGDADTEALVVAVAEDLTEVTEVTEVTEAEEAVFLGLAGPDEEASNALFDTVKKTVGIIEAQGKAVVFQALDPESAEFAEVCDELSLDTFPCVVLVLGSRAPKYFFGGASEGDMLAAFVEVSAAAAAPDCTGPGCGSGGC